MIPIPDQVWARIKVFFAQKKKGRITLWVEAGELVDWEFAERPQPGSALDEKKGNVVP